LSSHVLVNLRYYFEKVDQVEPSENLCSDEYPMEEYLYAPQRLAVDPKMGYGKVIDYVNGVRCCKSS
jgi:hypothetical protein